MNTTNHEAPETQDQPRRGRPPKAETQQRRRKSRAVAGAKRLSVPESLTNFKKFAYRWINDDGIRFYSLTEEDDWELAPQNPKDEANSVDIGSAIKRVVGRNADGSPMYAYLCRKLRKFYDDDKADKQAVLDEELEQIRRGNARNGQSQSDYTPNSGIKV
jgi:hypothetical protein